MRTTPPPGFDVTTFFADVNTFQSWEIFPGARTTGSKDVTRTLDDLGVPSDLRGRRVLDIGPWNGFFSFECARRGASEVVSVGLPDPTGSNGYAKTRELLEIEQCRYVQGSVYDITPAQYGTFDLVLFLGVIYHLRYPLLALDRIYDVAIGDLYVDTPIIDELIFDQTITDDLRRTITEFCRPVHHLPLAYFTKGAETGDPTNWFLPNRRAFRSFVESAGFKVVSTGDDGGGWGWLSAVKDQRSFLAGLEGFNHTVEGVLHPSARAPNVDFSADDAMLRHAETLRIQAALATATAARDNFAAEAGRWFDAAIVAPVQEAMRRRRSAFRSGLSRLARLLSPGRSASACAAAARSAGEWERSARFAADALIAVPDSPKLWIDFAESLERLRRYDEARMARDRAAQL